MKKILCIQIKQIGDVLMTSPAVNAIKNELPNENLIYFGDTAHLPYGDKSTATIQAYAIKIADFFLQQKCKFS